MAGRTRTEVRSVTDLYALAERLHRAAVERTPLPGLTDDGELNLDTAYEVQRILVARRLSAGEWQVGLKMGLTNRVRMAQLGVSQPVWGRLTSGMRVPDGGEVSVDRLIDPWVEPEVAFRLDGRGRPVAAAAALEVLDSRYADPRSSLPEVVADNASAAVFVVGPWGPLPSNPENLGVLLEVDGEVVETGSTAAILGDPRRSLATGLAMAGAAGLTPQEGWVFLAGAATEPVRLRAGVTVRAAVEDLGTATLSAVAGERPQTATGRAA